MKKLCVILLLILSFQVKAQIDLSIIAEIESNGNIKAINRTDGGSRGKYQIHPVCLKKYNEIHKTSITLDSLFNEETNKMIAIWYFTEEIPRLLSYYGYHKTISNILVCYNAGIDYLVSKRSIPRTTQSYIARYMKLRDIKLSKAAKPR